MSGCSNVQEVSGDQDAEWARAFIWTANAIGLIYNIPQVVHTIRTKKTGDISGLFLIMRMVSSSMWCFYSIYFLMYDVLISWIITLSSTLVIMYYKYVYKAPIQIEEERMREQREYENSDNGRSEYERSEYEQHENEQREYDIIVLDGEKEN